MYIDLGIDSEREVLLACATILDPVASAAGSHVCVLRYGHYRFVESEVLWKAIWDGSTRTSAVIGGQMQWRTGRWRRNQTSDDVKLIETEAARKDPGSGTI